ncbi:autotransporter-associated beta strand repeat-containing protein [Verrucomicrobium sp. BvORR034]|uniref:beta strand repeat-containing protein n=1 Tax=Verrucomicrobium sp. BvORR034 TaxID=1396418 RepID=UPI002240EB7C|nr:autotransporter-associated beta strand repeat-containing protein [Verrucomicrobium sp. BvORR034]
MKRLKTSAMTRLLRRRHVASLAASITLLAHTMTQAAPYALDLTGTISYDGWANLFNPPYSGVIFPGSGAWPTTGAWTSYDPDGEGGAEAVGAIGSNTANSGDALLYKISNGSGGGPYPASGSIYFGGFSGDANVNGGTLGVVDTTPLAGVKTVAFQVDIGEATAYDFYKHELPILQYTTLAGGSTLYTLDPVQSQLLLQIYTGDILMPTGYEDLYRNTWGLQFDLSGITDTITSLQLSFTGVQHAQLYALQLDQSTNKYTTSVFATAATWDAGGSSMVWSDTANWNNDTTPLTGKAVQFSAGTNAILDASQTVQGVTINSPGAFSLTSQGGAVLTVGEAGITVTGSNPAAHSISAPLVFSSQLNIISVDAGLELNVTGNLTAPGFYKSGDGTLRLAGNNTLLQNSQNRVIVNGGEVYLSGVNTYSGTGTLEFEVKKGIVHLIGGDNRLSSNISVDLVSRRVMTDATMVTEESGHIVLGDSGGKMDQTVGGISAAATVVFQTATSATSYDAVSSSSITGGNAAISTLTADVTGSSSFTYLGSLGGAGTNENQLAFVKKGSGTQVLGGVSTYVGDTIVQEGVLRLSSTTALSSASHLLLSGGVLELAAGNFTRSLGTGAGQVQLTGNTGFSAYGSVRKVNLGGAGATVTWGTNGFLGDNLKLVLSSTVSDNTVEFENPIALGSNTRTVQVNNGSAVVDARLTGAVSGSGGFEKTGLGTLESTAANTHTGGTTVKEGTLALAGTAGAVKGDVEVAAGATFQLTNTEVAANSNRVEDSATVQLNGSILNFNNATTGTTQAFSETLGTLDLERGANVVTTSRAADGNIAVLTLNNLTRDGGATVNFNGTSVGADARNQVKFASAPTLDNGILGGWATAGNEWATYGTYGVTALTSYTTTGESTWTAADNVKFNNTTATTVTLTASRQVNSLNMVAPTSGTTPNTLNLGNQTLRVESGGILTSGGNSSRKLVISQGTLTAGTGNNTDGELIVVANGVTDISATISNNGTGEVSLVKAGSNSLTLTANNNYTGDTIVNTGTLYLNGSHTGGEDLIVRKGANLNLVGSIEVGGTLQIDGFMWGTGSLVFAPGSKLTGSGMMENSFTIGAGAGKIAVLAPGNSPGTLTTGSQTWTSGGTFLWEINATGIGGSNMGQNPGWDVLAINGSLDLTSLTAGAFDIDITSLTAENQSGLLDGFDFMSDYSWTIVTTTTGISGFEATDFNLDTAAFLNSYTGGSFNLAQSGNNLVLNYAGAVPEPGRAVLLLGGLISMVLRRRRSAANLIMN